MITPRISIIITAYNYEAYVGKCIESCLNQKGFDAFEVILVNDGSTDSTLSIAEKYTPALKIVTVPNGGVEKAGNHGIALARGEFCMRVDADDFLYPNCLATMAPYLDDKDWSFLYPDYVCVNAKDEIIREVALPSFDAEEIRERGDFLAGGTLYRKSALQAIGLYNTGIANCGLENYEVILNLLAQGGKGQHITEHLFAYRTHDKNMSLVRRTGIIEYGSKLAAKFGLPGYRTNANHPYGLVL